MKTKLIISGLAFMAITTLANAQNNTVPSRPQTNTGKGIAYVDANQNGICDNYENKTPNMSCARMNGNCRGGCAQGQMQGQGRGPGQGQCRNKNFVDADKNGICDFRESKINKQNPKQN